MSTHRCVLCERTPITPEMSSRVRTIALAELADLNDVAIEVAETFGKSTNIASDFIEQIIGDVCENCVDVALMRRTIEPLLRKVAADPLNLPVLFCWHDGKTGKPVIPHG